MRRTPCSVQGLTSDISDCIFRSEARVDYYSRKISHPTISTPFYSKFPVCLNQGSRTQSLSTLDYPSHNINARLITHLHFSLQDIAT